MLAASLVLAAAALQQVGPPPSQVANVNGWLISDHRGSCSATTTYDGNIVVHVSRNAARDASALFISNPAWASVQDGARYAVRLEFTNGASYDANAAGSVIEANGARLPGIVIAFDGVDFLADFAGAAGLSLSLGGRPLGSISLRGTRAVALRLGSCAAESSRRYPIDPFADVQPSSPAPSRTNPSQPTSPQRTRSYLNSYFSTDDYPAAALRANEQGTTGFTLTIGPNGRVADCSVTSSSGSSALDQATCRILRSRARYTPARDTNGNPTTGMDSGRVTWSLPPPPPPPPPLPQARPVQER